MRTQRGFTLIELLISLVLALVSAGEYVKLFIEAVEAKERRLQKRVLESGEGASPRRSSHPPDKAKPAKKRAGLRSAKR